MAKGDAIDTLKSAYSVALLILSIVLIAGLQFTTQTKVASEVHPVFAFVLLWAALLWLSMVEGGQAALVGLPPVDRSLYKNSHPITWAICEYGHKGDNLDRYLMGRQFMVLALVFTINQAGAPLADSTLWGLPNWVINIFFGSGAAMILLTCMVGQLNTQVNASYCMLDYINTQFMTFTLYVTMAIEFTGLLHASYLIKDIVASAAGKKVESNEPPRDGITNLFYWIRVLMSTAILIGALVVTFVALLSGRTTMWEAIPKFVAVALTLFLWCVVGMLEAMQIAFFAASRITEEERSINPWAKRTCHLLYHANNGHNLAAFMVGRQLCVVSCFFFAARATSMKIEEGEENVFGVPNAVQEFFNTGLLGALITTIIASIMWQFVASMFPLAFLSSPITYVLLVLCLVLEGTGICNGAWVIANIHKSVAGFQPDEVYVGTAEERAAGKVVPADAFRSQVGHLQGGAFPAGSKLLISEQWEEPIMGRRHKVLNNIKTIHELINMSQTESEKQVYKASLAQEVAALDRINKEHGDTSVAYKRQSSQTQLAVEEPNDDTGKKSSGNVITTRSLVVQKKDEGSTYSATEDYC